MGIAARGDRLARGGWRPGCRRARRAVNGDDEAPGAFAPGASSRATRGAAPRSVVRSAGQKPLTLRRPPVAVLPLSEAVGTALPRIAVLICAAVEPGCVDAYSAAPPLTCGVAIEVPL